jgi:hypothetical protein
MHSLFSFYLFFLTHLFTLSFFLSFFLVLFFSLPPTPPPSPLRCSPPSRVSRLALPTALSGRAAVEQEPLRERDPRRLSGPAGRSGHGCAVGGRAGCQDAADELLEQRRECRACEALQTQTRIDLCSAPYHCHAISYHIISCHISYHTTPAASPCPFHSSLLDALRLLSLSLLRPRVPLRHIKNAPQDIDLLRAGRAGLSLDKDGVMASSAGLGCLPLALASASASAALASQSSLAPPLAGDRFVALRLCNIV